MNITVLLHNPENINYYKAKKITLDIEDYVKIAVASEIGNALLEACKAQAIVIRSIIMAYGVLRDGEISDNADYLPKFQARRNSPKYTKCIKAVNLTKGKVLIWDNKIINAKYTTANGGKTVSSAEGYGNPQPFLIAQIDPWDKATKIGSGVGMSQRGAVQAAKLGKTYKDILAFYYPGTFIQSDYNNTKGNKVITIAQNSLGHPYVFGALGETCTPNNRRKYVSSAHPEVVNKCQVLKGKKKTCADCPYQNGRIYDCRGFTYYCLRQVGISISSIGATAQWDTNSWVLKGETKNGVPNLVCCVFKKKGNLMSHTALHIGNGTIIECSGQVQYNALDDPTWTHWAIPKGLHSNEYIAAVRRLKIMPTLEKGNKGTEVVKLQTMLKDLGFNCKDVKGTYGTSTAAAVSAFQEQYGLLVDGMYNNTTASILENIYSKRK